MHGPARQVRGRPFQRGNPGRPPGSKNKTTQALEQLAEGQAEQVFQKVVEQSLAGDVRQPADVPGSCLCPAQSPADQRHDAADKETAGRDLRPRLRLQSTRGRFAYPR